MQMTYLSYEECLLFEGSPHLGHYTSLKVQALWVNEHTEKAFSSQPDCTFHRVKILAKGNTKLRLVLRNFEVIYIQNQRKRNASKTRLFLIYNKWNSNIVKFIFWYSFLLYFQPFGSIELSNRKLAAIFWSNCIYFAIVGLPRYYMFIAADVIEQKSYRNAPCYCLPKALLSIGCAWTPQKEPAAGGKRRPMLGVKSGVSRVQSITNHFATLCSRLRIQIPVQCHFIFSKRFVKIDPRFRSLRIPLKVLQKESSWLHIFRLARLHGQHFKLATQWQRHWQHRNPRRRWIQIQIEFTHLRFLIEIVRICKDFTHKIPDGFRGHSAEGWQTILDNKHKRKNCKIKIVY